MIKQWFPSKKEKPRTQTAHGHNLTPYNNDIVDAAKAGLSAGEYRIRKKMVHDAVNDFYKKGFRVGDFVRPDDDAAYSNYGDMEIIGICFDYKDYGTVKWNDPPLILQVREREGTGRVVNCSTGWIKKKENVC